ncbi:DUF7144 family membrane protein [Actinoplanes utahensis]|nr:hypothetical protein [Actinoplanes utahensis]GIF30202.1 hypothetical protein Aut01nite_31880 [Actinoplanes utahensis]
MTIDHPAAPGSRTPPGTPGSAGMSGGAGLAVFGGIMLLCLGTAQLVEGITALARDQAYMVTGDGMLFELDATAWGWGHLICGLISIAAGVGVLRGLIWARIIAVLFTAAAALVSFLLLANSPFWFSIMICGQLLVIYGLCAHGGELRRHRHA